MNKKSGVTFIEIIIYTVLLSMVLGLVTNFFYQAINYKALNQVETDLYQNSQLVFNKISRDLQKTRAVISPENEIFSDELIIDLGTEQITYRINQGRLERNGVVLTDSTVKILTKENSGFRKLNKTVQVKLVFSANLKPFGRQRKEREYQTTIFLSNEQ